MPDRVAQRQQLIARIAQDREALRGTVAALRRPMQTVERWRGRVRAVLPILPGILVAFGITVLLFRTLRGSRRSTTLPVATVVVPARSSNWFGLALQIASAYRVAMQVRALVQASKAAPVPLRAPSASLSQRTGVPSPDTHFSNGGHRP